MILTNIHSFQNEYSFALNGKILQLIVALLSSVAWYSEAPWYFEALVKLTMDIQLAWYSEVPWYSEEHQSCDHDAIIYIVLI